MSRYITSSEVREHATRRAGTAVDGRGPPKATRFCSWMQRATGFRMPHRGSGELVDLRGPGRSRWLRWHRQTTFFWIHACSLLRSADLTASSREGRRSSSPPTSAPASRHALRALLDRRAAVTPAPPPQSEKGPVVHEEITVADARPRHLAVVTFEARTEQIGSRIGAGFATVGAWLGRHRTAPTGPPVAHYTMAPGGFRVQAGFPVAVPVLGDEEVAAFDLPASRVVTTVHVGSYAHLPDTYDAVHAYAAEHGLHLDESSMWEEYLTGPEDGDRTRTRISWPTSS